MPTSLGIVWSTWPSVLLTRHRFATPTVSATAAREEEGVGRRDSMLDAPPCRCLGGWFAVCVVDTKESVRRIVRGRRLFNER